MRMKALLEDAKFMHARQAVVLSAAVARYCLGARGNWYLE